MKKILCTMFLIALSVNIQAAQIVDNDDVVLINQYGRVSTFTVNGKLYILVMTGNGVVVTPAVESNKENNRDKKK